MAISVQSRILSGFGLVLAVLAASAVCSGAVVRSIDRHAHELHATLARKDAALDLDLSSAEIRIWVNRWLATRLPEDADEADRLIARHLSLLFRTRAQSTADATVLERMTRQSAAYRESWRGVRSLFGQEADIFDGRLDRPAEQIVSEIGDVRDSAQSAGNADLGRQATKALESFSAANADASRFRISDNEADAERSREAIGDTTTDLDAAVGLAKDADDLASIKSIEGEIGTWSHSLDLADKVALARAERVSTVASLGEALARAAAELRANCDLVARGSQVALLANLVNARLVLWLSTGVAVCLCLVLSLLIARSITRPLRRITGALNALAAGDDAVEIPEHGRKDEIGRMANAAQVFKDNAIAIRRITAEQELLEQRAQEEKREAMRSLADRFEERVGCLVHALSSEASGLEQTAQSMSSNAERAGHQAMTVDAAAHSAGSAVQTVASAAAELTVSIGEISRQVAETASMSSIASRDAERTTAIVRALSEAAHRIGEVVGLVSSIAKQTNLLALNATIEAARAGDAGRGFAVVASEVKNLATQTGDATGQIGGLVEQIQSATREAVDAVRSIAGKVEAVSQISTMIAAAVEEQSAATAEIARNVRQTAQATDEVTINIGGVTEAANSTGLAAGQVLVAASDLSQQTTRLSGEVKGFVAEVRAA